MALYAFDGTWDVDAPGGNETDTNIVWFRDAYNGRTAYLEGIGTRCTDVERFAGGALGAGGRQKVSKMLDMFASNPSGEPVDIIGFSRGAAMALDFANRIDVPVRFLGLFDTVPSFGLSWINWLDSWLWKLNVPKNVVCCRHAMALSERRVDFNLHRPKLLSKSTDLDEVWFLGVHGDVGGGKKDARAAIALRWMFHQAHACGVDLHQRVVDENAARLDEKAPVSGQARYWLRHKAREMRGGDKLHESVFALGDPIGDQHDGPFIVVDDADNVLRLHP